MASYTQITLKSGKKVWRVRQSYMSNGKRKYLTQQGFTTKKAAQDWTMEQLRHLRQDGEITQIEPITFRDFYAIWYQKYCIELQHLKPQTLYRYRCDFQVCIMPIFGERLLSSITTEDLQDYLNEMADKYSYTRVVSLRSHLTSLFRYAAAPGKNHLYLRTNPAIGLQIPRGAKKRSKEKGLTKDVVIMTKDEWQRILKRFPEGTSPYLPMQIAYHLGTRKGETFGLYWDDIDWDKHLIRIDRQVQPNREAHAIPGLHHADGGFPAAYYITDPKDDSNRTISFDSGLYRILDKAYDQYLKNRKLYGSMYCQMWIQDTFIYQAHDFTVIKKKDSAYPVNFICSDSSGCATNPGITKYFVRVIQGKENDPAIAPDWHFHTLRHTNASMLRAAGVPEVVIQQRLGHVNLSMTEHYDQHITDVDRAKEQAILNTLF